MTTNRHGFPIENCTRCGGTGQMPYDAYNGVCLKCNGEGTFVTRKAHAAWLAYRAAAPEKAVTAGSLKVGDKVLANLSSTKTAGTNWATVTRIEVTPERCGSSLTGTNEADRVHYYYLSITLDNGFSRKVSEKQMVRRFITTEMIPNPRDFWPVA